jgi:outer membrane protein TolC
MRRALTSLRRELVLAATALATLSGCATVSLEQNLQRVNDETGSFVDGRLTLARTDDERAQSAQAANALLGFPLGQLEAVQLALITSPALQALLAQGWAAAAQDGRIANPIVSIERLSTGSEVEIARALAFGLLDLLTLPARQDIAEHRIEQSQLRLAGDVVDQVTQVRQAWVRAVAAQQVLRYAQQVYASAEAGAELARRMQAVGNFNRIDRAREQAFYADAATRLAMATHQVTVTREDLVRLLGLDEAQSKSLRLPKRLPDLPKRPLASEAVAAAANRSRLDVRLAQATLDASAKAQGLNRVTSFTDIELIARRDTTRNDAAGTRADLQGYEVAVRLPLFDSGDMQRDAMDARTLAAANQLEATVRAAGSSLRQSYSAYRTAYDIARHHRTEVVPLRKAIAEENQLRYNGMLIGVFELLADSRDQVSTVMAAIDAEKQFWLTDAALQASLIGRPVDTSLTVAVGMPVGGSAAH